MQLLQLFHITHYGAIPRGAICGVFLRCFEKTGVAAALFYDIYLHLCDTAGASAEVGILGCVQVGSHISVAALHVNPDERIARLVGTF